MITSTTVIPAADFSVERLLWGRRLWHLLEPIHAVTYFSPEPIQALKVVGLPGFWMGYFAGRSAPLGEASADQVQRTFYTFHRHHIAQAIPDAWAYASPHAALTARREGSAAALTRCLAATKDLAPTSNSTDLLMGALEGAASDGLELFTAHRNLLQPVESIERLWHAATLFREHRGDHHMRALRAAELSGPEATVLHALAQGTPYENYRKGRLFEPPEWEATLFALSSRGLADGGRLTDDGMALRRQVELATDAASAVLLQGFSDEALRDLAHQIAPVTQAVLNSGDIPRQSVIGLDLADVATTLASHIHPPEGD